MAALLGLFWLAVVVVVVWSLYQAYRDGRFLRSAAQLAVIYLMSATFGFIPTVAIGLGWYVHQALID